MNNTVSMLANEIMEPILINKLAHSIVSPCLEKEAASGLAAFGEALTGSKVKKLKGEYNELANDMLEKTKNSKLHSAYNDVSKVKDSMNNISSHDRMSGVKSNLEEKEKNLNDVMQSHDETLNHYTGLRTLLRPVSPEYLGAKADIVGAKMGVRSAKSQYRAQEGRIRAGLNNELNTAQRKFDDVKKETGTYGLDDKVKQKEKELQHAQDATGSARRIAGGAVAGIGGGAYYLHKKNNPTPGPYSYDGGYSSNEGYSNYAGLDDSELVEKLASEIIQSIYDR